MRPEGGEREGSGGKGGGSLIEGLVEGGEDSGAVMPFGGEGERGLEGEGRSQQGGGATEFGDSFGGREKLMGPVGEGG